jgi:hypothetical protein
MKTRFLFPHQFKTLGWIFFIPSLVLSIVTSIFDINTDQYLNIQVPAIYLDQFFGNKQYFQLIKNNIVDELLVLGLIIGGILVGFAKLKVEDEMISKIRYESMVWAIYLNYLLIILFTIFTYGVSYLAILMYNTFTLLLFFIIRFQYMLYKLNRANQDDE